MVYPFGSPFTPKLFQTHLERMKQWSSPEIPSTAANETSDIDIINTQTPTPYSMSDSTTPPSSLKRNPESLYEDQSPSKRARTQSTRDTVTKRLLVPVISRQETDTQLQALQELDKATAASYGETDFVVNLAGHGTPDVRHGSGLSNWRTDGLAPPSSFMDDEGEEGLFPALGDMASYALNEGDLDLAAGPAHGQEGVNDDGEAVQLDADGLPMMDDEPVPEPTEESAKAEQADKAEEADKQPIVTYDLDDSDDDADMDAFIAEANGTRAYRPPIKRLDEVEAAESSEVTTALVQPPQISHVQYLDGVHQLVTSDGQVDQFIIDTGATPEREKEHNGSQVVNTRDSAQEREEQPRRVSAGHPQHDVQPRDAEPDQIDEQDLPIIGQNDSALTQSYKAQGYMYQHPSKRFATPPPPTSIIAALPAVGSCTSYNVNKTAASTSALRTQELAKLAGTAGPVAGRDHCQVLNNYQDFYQKAIHCIPDLPHWKEFDWSRRYWIAVLYANKRPKTANKAKDFMWMKGNCFSTVSTIWHNYALRTMEEDFVLTCRGELMDMKDQVQELDWFNQKFVVFRAIKTDSRDYEKIPGLTTNVGVVPEFAPEVAGEVIEILDD